MSDNFLPHILNDASKVHQQISLALRESKKNLEKIKKAEMIEMQKFRNSNTEKQRLEKNLHGLEALLLSLKNEIYETERRNEEFILKVDHIMWKQSKADLIADSEKKAFERKEAYFKEYIDKIEDQTIIGSMQVHGEGNQEILKILYERKRNLVAELNEIKTKVTDVKTSMRHIEQENRVLQKRNTALILRLQRLLKEMESKRIQLSVQIDGIKQ